MRSGLKKAAPWLVLVLFPWLAYWQVGFMQNCMKWDIMDQYFQYRYFMSDALHNGVWPLWMPWQYFGFPFFADPQSGAWYLPAWVLSGLTQYGLVSLHFEWLLHIALGGLGVYHLLRTLKVSTLSALLMALLFEANGVFVGNAQHLAYVIGMSWLPWVFAGFYKLMQEGGFKNAIATAFFLHLLLTGGYPSYFFITFYLLAFWFAIEVFSRWKNGRDWKRTVIGTGLSGVVWLVFSAGYLCAIYEGSQQMPRGEGLELDQILFGPYPPHAFVSQWAPIAVAGNMDYFGSDYSMINGYAGLLSLLCIPFAFLNVEKRRLSAVILGVSLICLLASFGGATPIRAIWAEFLPIMDRFRFPSVFRSFWILGLITLGGLGLHQLLQSKKNQLKPLLIWAAILMIFPLYWWFAMDTSTAFNRFPLFVKSWLEFSGYREYLFNSTPGERLLPGLMIAYGFILLYAISLSLKIRWKAIPIVLVVLVALEGIVAIQLNLPLTITHERPAAEYRTELKNSPEGYPHPDNTPLERHRPADPRFLPSWGNNNTFNKTISPIGFNPFKLSRIYELEQRDCYREANQMPAFFLTSEMRHCSECTIEEWRPGKARIVVNSSRADTLVFQQTAYPGWTLKINGESRDIKSWCGNHLLASLLPGDNYLTFTFKRNDIVFWWIWQGVAYLFFLALVPIKMGIENRQIDRQISSNPPVS